MSALTKENGSGLESLRKTMAFAMGALTLTPGQGTGVRIPTTASGHESANTDARPGNRSALQLRWAAA
jgi:hypothetical protein